MKLEEYGLWIDIGLRAQRLDVHKAVERASRRWENGHSHRYPRVAFAIYKHGMFQGNVLVHESRIEFTGSKEKEDVWNTVDEFINEVSKLLFGLEKSED